MNRINKQMVDSTLTEKEVEKIAEETAKALGSKFSVTKDSVDNRSFSLDYDGVKYDGGSYLIMYNGDIVNVAIMKAPIYYNYKTKKKYEFGGDFQAGVYAGGGGVGAYYIVTFGFNGDEGYQVVNSKPIFAKSENEAELMLKDQFESYEGVSCEIISTKKQLATGGGVGLIGNQKRIDMNKNGRIDAEDFKILRSTMNGAWRNERKHVNHSEDYEVRYAKPRPSRTGYKGKRSFDDGGSIDAFTIRMVRGTSGKPTEVISDPREVKFATGGGVEYVPVNQKISKKEKDEFLEYIDGFYGKKGIYADDLKGGFSKVELRKAMNTYLKQLGSAPTWGYGDSVDRERVRQILQPSYKMFNEGGFMSRLLTRKKDQPKVETINEDIDLKDDSRIRVKSSSFVRKNKEGDWMMKNNSSKEARAYAGGGKTETPAKKGKGNHKMKATTDLAKKIRKDGEKWTDALRRASQQMK